MTDNHKKWTNSEPGVLALTGTAWRILYDPSPGGDFLIMQGDRKRSRMNILAIAKTYCESWQVDLEEIGVA